jgi:hypothetical protein
VSLILHGINLAALENQEKIPLPDFTCIKGCKAFKRQMFRNIGHWFFEPITRRRTKKQMVFVDENPFFLIIVKLNFINSYIVVTLRF